MLEEGVNEYGMKINVEKTKVIRINSSKKMTVMTSEEKM